MVLDTKRKYELVIYGASGFTGKYVVEIFATYIAEKKLKIKWAVAGRNKKKLEETLDHVAELIDQDLSDIPIVICDTSYADQIYEMTTNAQVILNCVGPYSLLGEQIVSVCVRTKTHHLDISGEPLFLERMELKYHDEARKNGVYIIGACGWDSVPAEIGFQRAKRNFVKNVGTPCYVESYVKSKNPKGMVIHSGTWRSFIDSFSEISDLKAIRDAFPPLPKNVLRAPKHSLFYNNLMAGYCFTLAGSDRSVVYRTQRHFYENKQIQPIDYEPYFYVGQWYHVLALLPLLILFSLLINFQMGRDLMKEYPSLFSFGLFSDKGPTREMVMGNRTSHFFVTHGSKEKNADLSKEIPSEDLIISVTAIDGPDPGYIATPIYLIQAGLTVLNEHSSLPAKGGVFTPAVAFANTHFERSLSQAGIQFSTIDMEETDRLSMSSTGSGL